MQDIDNNNDRSIKTKTVFTNTCVQFCDYHVRASTKASHVNTRAVPLLSPLVDHGQNSDPYHSAHRRWAAEFVSRLSCLGTGGGLSAITGTGNLDIRKRWIPYD